MMVSTRSLAQPRNASGPRRRLDGRSGRSRSCVFHASVSGEVGTSTMHAVQQAKTDVKVLVAGGGIGGLVTGLALQSRGIDCVVFEKVTQYKPFGGPIQMAGNALSMLEAIHPGVAAEVEACGAITGDRVNGLLDGNTGDWYVRFDTRKPAYNYGLPLTQVVSRYRLLEIMSQKLKEGSLRTGAKVVAYEERADGKVVCRLEDGSEEVGDILVGADGIRSEVRRQMKENSFFADEPRYSGYTCYTGIANYTPDDIDEIGYQVFLGCERYFVASDVGEGQVQWYAFQKRESDTPQPGCLKEQVQNIFGDWCDEVNVIINKTEVVEIENRDIYDRIPTLGWVDGKVALLGDAAHAMQPNMGQGGCQTIEDAYHLSLELARMDSVEEIPNALQQYERERVLRCAAVQGFARAAALMATTYRPYLGSKPYNFYKYIPGAMALWAWTEKNRVPHPGRVVGQIAMMLSIDLILDYITGGNQPIFEERAPYCQLPGVESRRKRLPEKLFRMKGIPGFAN